MKHTLVALVENEPGVLNRVASLFRRRNFNIDSLTVGRTESPCVSRMTIVVDSTVQNTSSVEKNLYKLVNVITVQDVTNTPLISRDLALVKVRAAEGVSRVCQEHGARTIDASDDVVIVEMSDTEDRIESLIGALHPFGIVELVRTGVVSMGRGQNVLNTPITSESDAA
ncbi:MAG: acetolactate synthase small subunit [Aggregatilineales bacterium]